MKRPPTDTIRDELALLERSFESTRRTGQVEWDKVLSSTERIRKEVALLEGDLVNVLRTFGKSWTEIGEELGISRQAAWERFHHAVKEAQARTTDSGYEEEPSS
jgi:hypothetical protein